MNPAARQTPLSSTLAPRPAPAQRPLVSRWAPYLFLGPYVLITLVFLLYPFFHAAGLAFFQTAGPLSRVWVGMGNFEFIAGDADFRKALVNTSIFAVCNALFMLPLSLGLALLLNGAKDRMKGVFRLIFFAPSVVGQIFVGIIFSVIFVPRYGLMNLFLQDLMNWGLDTKWLQEPSMVLPAIVITNLWLYAGFNMVYFLAALQTVDQSLVEAARIDGARPAPCRHWW
jgi:ABC-type sugar transport system permease subunit